MSQDMSEDETTTRRNVLKAGGAAGVLLAGGAGAMALTGSAAAEATASENINKVTAESDDGTIEFVNINSEGTMEWDGFDNPATHAEMQVEVLIGRDGKHFEGTIHETDMFSLEDAASGEWGDDEGSSGPGTNGYLRTKSDWDIIQAEGYESSYDLPTDPAPASYLYSHEDDSTTETLVTLRSTYTLYGDGGSTRLTGTDGYPENPVAEKQFKVAVTNQDSTVNFPEGESEVSVGTDSDK